MAPWTDYILNHYSRMYIPKLFISIISDEVLMRLTDLVNWNLTVYIPVFTLARNLKCRSPVIWSQKESITMWKIFHFYLKNVSTESPMNAESVEGLGFSINGVNYLPSNVMPGHSHSFYLPPEHCRGKDFRAGRCLRCDPKKSENEKEKERERRQEAVHYKVSTVGNESFILPGLRFVQNTM